MKKIKRTGTNTKLIHYSQAKVENRFNYQDNKSLLIQNPAIELKGTLNIPVKTLNSNSNESDYNPFRKMNLKILPNTNRTLVTELQEVPRSKSSLNLKEPREVTRRVLNDEGVNYTGYINNNCGQTKKYSSKCNLDYQKSTVFKPPNQGPYVKPHIKFNEFSKYSQTTQVTNLPGGEKRLQTDINDDVKYIREKLVKGSGKSTQKKIEKDLNSNVSCLPTSSVSYLFII